MRWFLPEQLFLLLLLLFSCNGQYEKNLREIKVESTEANRTGEETSTPWIDPLFYIDGQLCAWVRNIFQDSRGDLWFATNHYGIMRYSGDTLEFFDKKNGLGAGRVTGIAEDEKGNIWIGTYGGLSKFDPSVTASDKKPLFTTFANRPGLPDNEIWSLIIDKKGTFWVGTMEGVCQFDGENFTPFHLPKVAVKDTNTILSYRRITSILETDEGTIWIALDGFGICIYDPRSRDKNFTHITKESGLPDNNIADLMQDSKGNIWLGSMFGGISCFDGKSFKNFTEEGVIGGEEAYGFYEDKKGNIWFAAENFGVYRYNGETFTNFNKDNGLNTNGVISIFEDNKGRFWFGGWGGLFRYDPTRDGLPFYSVSKDIGWEE